MSYLIGLGAGLAISGLGILIYCIVRVAKARRAKLTDEDLRAEVQRVVPINLVALFLSVMGLMMVVTGIMLGS